MKLNRILKYAAVSALAFSTGLTTVSCTDDFETLNTDQYEVDPNTLPFSAQFKEPLSYVYAPQQNLFQYCFSLNVDLFSGYFMTPHNFNGSGNVDYALNRSFCGGMYENVYLHIFNNTRRLIASCDEQGLTDYAGMMRVVQAYAVQMLTDVYGPVAYTSCIEDPTNGASFSYDTQQSIYNSIFELLDKDTKVEFFCKDGDEVKNGQLMGKVTGDIRVLLSGERVALNYLQRMSGIASYTRSVVSLLGESKTKLLDTRKTTPNMRIFEKYAVRAGGGYNHRYNLSDGVLLKDNHIGAAGSITKAVQMAKAYAPFVRKIEIEVETLEQVKEAVDAGADIIMLDNMTPDMMKEAVQLIDGRAQTECSGNITKENIAKICEIGVDFVSSGALTHSAPILDISMKNLHAV